MNQPRTTDATVFDATGEAQAVRAPFRERLSWALYDFANTIFSMNIATLYFTAWMVEDLGSSNTLYAAVNGVASALVVVSIPVLGAISDARRQRKWWVVGFTLASCVACACIGIFGQTSVPLFGEGVIGGASMPTTWHATAWQLRWVLVAFII